MPQPNSAAAWPAGHWPTTRSTGRPSAAASAAPTPARSCGWSTTTATRSAPDAAGPARGQARPARAVGGLDAHHRPGPHRRRRFPVDPRPRRPGDHPRRLQGDARRRARRAGEPSRRARARPWSAGPTTASARRRSPWSSCGMPRPPMPTSCWSILRTRLARYEIPTEIAIVDAIPRTPSGKPDLTAVGDSSLARVKRDHRRRGTARAGGVAGRASAAGLRRRAAQLRRGRPPLGQLARGLIALGAGKGTHVGLLYPNGADFVVGDAGGGADRRRGGAVLHVRHRAASCASNSSHSDVEILLAAASYRGTRLSRQRLTADRSRDRADPRCCATSLHRRRTAGDTVDERAARRRWKTTSTARIRWRSSTRRARPSAPKGVVHTHAALLGHQRNLNEIRGLTADDRLFCNSPFFWIGGFAFGAARHPGRRRHAGVLQRRRRRRDARPAGGREAHHDQRFRRGHRAPGPPPELRATATCRRCGAATCTRSWRPTCGRPIPNCGTTCSA